MTLLDKANVLRSNPLFAGWPEFLRKIAAKAFTPVTVKEGEEIIKRGESSQADWPESRAFGRRLIQDVANPL